MHSYKEHQVAAQNGASVCRASASTTRWVQRIGSKLFMRVAQNLILSPTRLLKKLAHHRPFADFKYRFPIILGLRFEKPLKISGVV
jgi:hypothetical protein